jgi:cation diffusion facilitator family transporter
MESVMNTSAKTLLIGIALLIIKFAAYFLTHSNAILTDALESIINVLAGGFGLFALYLSGLPKDENHPYGHGKIEFISASLEGSFIAIAGALMMYTAVLALWNPHILQQLDWGLGLVGITGVVNYMMGKKLVEQGEAEKSPAMRASGEHLISDAYTTAALFVGLCIVLFTDIMWLDSVLAFAMGVLLMQTGFQIVKSSVSGIMDETNYQLATDIIECLEKNRKANWIDIHNFRIIQYGSALHIDCHITVPHYFTVAQAHDILKEFEATLTANTEREMEVFIHTDPCLPTLSCAICAKTDCAVREKPFAKQLSWTLENVLRNEKHCLQ